MFGLQQFHQPALPRLPIFWFSGDLWNHSDSQGDLMNHSGSQGDRRNHSGSQGDLNHSGSQGDLQKSYHFRFLYPESQRFHREICWNHLPLHCIYSSFLFFFIDHKGSARKPVSTITVGPRVKSC